jgi:hypothetical protein
VGGAEQKMALNQILMGLQLQGTNNIIYFYLNNAFEVVNKLEIS